MTTGHSKPHSYIFRATAEYKPLFPSSLSLPRAESVKRGEWDLLPTQGILKDGSKQRNQRGEKKKKVARVRAAHKPRLPGLGKLSTADLFFIVQVQTE